MLHQRHLDDCYYNKNSKDREEWINEIERRAFATSMKFEDPEAFMLTHYSSTISMIADKCKNPKDREEWINEIERRAFETSKKFKEPI